MRPRVRSEKRTFEVIITHWPDTPGTYKYSAEVPTLPGCVSDGRTREEAIENIKDAIGLYLKALEKQLDKKDVVIVHI